MKPCFWMFDFDGTLVDTAPDIAVHANAVLAGRGLPQQSVSAVQSGIGWGVRELFMNLTPGHTWDASDLEAAVLEFKRLYAERPVITTAAYAGVIEMLSGPLAAYPKAILTNKPHTLTVAILEQLDLMKHFRFVLGEGNGFPKKPDPSGALHLMREAGFKPAESVLIGDSQIDLETAKNAGTGFVWMDYGYDNRLRGDASIARLSSAAEWGNLRAA